mgnify:FL=1|jgi:hypothetical protein
MSRTKNRKELSPAQLATLMKTAELRVKGKTSTCDFFPKSR